MEVKPIKTERAYLLALRSMEKLFDAKPGTSRGNEAELLMILIEDYERQHYAITAPSPVEAIKFRMEQMNLRQKDLAPYLGSESRVSEILSGKRSLTLDMIIALQQALNIPLQSLVNSEKRDGGRTHYAQKRLPHHVSLAREGKVSYLKKKFK